MQTAALQQPRQQPAFYFTLTDPAADQELENQDFIKIDIKMKIIWGKVGNMTFLEDFLAPKTLSELKELLSQATNLVDATDFIDQVGFIKNKQKFVFENDAQWVKILTDMVNMSNNKPNLSLYLELSTDPVASKKTGQRGTKKHLSFSPQEDSSDEEESDQVKTNVNNKRNKGSRRKVQLQRRMKGSTN